ncbi:MAG: adenylate/guanylate cyclase domain-containing protein [Alphaproteobacteria bacterium]|nr:adenylate/guanylate cyclase domain-containing protein [Alphaproteobacteria bacterium]MDP6518134.1 adenylate/guanylate cyclase domain-containing protein [Alphaproteobacteria bacterium]
MRSFVNRVRLYSGLVLLVFVSLHLGNHVLGLVSLEVMNAARVISIDPWRTIPGTVLLAGATVTHMATSIWALYSRRSLRLPPWQLAQTMLGLLIPLMLAGHVIGTRFLVETFDVNHSYTVTLSLLWVLYPWLGLQQAVTLIVVWIHGCIGVHFWLRLKPWYAARQRLAFTIALLIPTLALAGYVSAGNRALALARQDDWLNQVFITAGAAPEMVDWVFYWNYASQGAFAALLAGLMIARAARALVRARSRHPQLYYDDRDPLEIAPGMTLLEVLRTARIPHASVCGGHGRCSTCRVHIDRGGDWLAPPSPSEQKVLERISAPASVRLACQLRPAHDLAVSPLLVPTATAADAYQRTRRRDSEERSVAILFADLRGFTRLAENRLPYDVVFVLNRYRVAMAEAIEDAGGVVNEFVGDGIMALFGLDSGLSEGCRDAIRAARLMAERLDRLNESLGAELAEPLRIGIGIHSGPVIVGEMGYDNLKGITVVGDVVNTASRLEGMTKNFSAQLVVSEDTAALGGLARDDAERHDVEIRGRAQGMTILVLGQTEHSRP